ncbi:hypothetical protein DB30_04867 [Enhygromyxa salina]|uniref:DNA-binding domain-containing protein n=1 Tax=Enhygromyxa salina TaxID=215803 RepID=A0A0C1ZEQ8_9BACT|nr:hypothetical protein [Enhygromyxa salina]KIG16149.1 hypothetical protein DB30_04867 [Enhygromyxa salina]
MSKLDPRRIQQALVCMMFDPVYAGVVRGPAPLDELSPRERELLRGVDPRGLATDDMRRARALHVILDEYPVSAALLGVEAVDQYFSSPAFRACVFERGSMALVFGRRYLLGASDKLHGIGAIETAMASARRVDRQRHPGLGSAPGLAPVSVPAGSLAWYQRARARLGPEPLQALTKLRKPWPQKPPRGGREHLLIEAKGDGSLAIGTASAALVGLLIAADPPRPRAELVAAAIELGAEADEADELLDDLIAEGLLIQSEPRAQASVSDRMAFEGA